MTSDPRPQFAAPGAAPPAARGLAPLALPLLLAALFITLHFNFLRRMFLVATDRWGGDWSHALAIPFIGGLYIYRQRHELARLPITTGWLGLPILLAGIFAYAIAIHPGRNDMLQGYAMIVSLFGLLWFLLGPALMRVLWFPVAFLALGVKVSDRIWEQLAWKLQLLAAQAATIALNLLGLDAQVHGSTIDLFEGTRSLGKLNVAEACSGLRMLMAFISLGVAMAFLARRRWWQRLIMVLSTVPIALLVNIGRVTIMGLVYRHDPQLTTGALHQFVGMLMLVPALLLFMALGWVLEHIVIRAPDDAAPTTSTPNPVPSGLTSPPSTPIRVTSSPPSSATALATGALITTLLGLAYILFLASRSTALFDDRLSRPSATALMLTCIAAAMACAWWIHRRMYSCASRSPTTSQPMPLPSGLARSLSARVASASALALGVLLASVIGLNTIVRASGAALRKLPVPVRKPLFVIPDRLGSWQKLHDDPHLTPEMLESLGTTHYLSRAYRDTAWSQPTGAIAKLHIAYYTGTPDTVPHVPERCFVAAGMEGIGKKTVAVTLPGAPGMGAPATMSSSPSNFELQPSSFSLPLTVFTFASPDRPQVQANVVYFFIANGAFLPSPDHVRLRGFNLTDRYAYYCKVEIGMFDVGDPDIAARRAADLLTTAMPQIMNCLPDWTEVQQGRWPPP